MVIREGGSYLGMVWMVKGKIKKERGRGRCELPHEVHLSPRFQFFAFYVSVIACDSYYRFFCVKCSQSRKVDGLLHYLLIPLKQGLSSSIFDWQMVGDRKACKQATTTAGVSKVAITCKEDRRQYLGDRFHDKEGHLGNIQGKDTCRGSKAPINWNINLRIILDATQGRLPE